MGDAFPGLRNGQPKSKRFAIDYSLFFPPFLLAAVTFVYVVWRLLTRNNPSAFEVLVPVLGFCSTAISIVLRQRSRSGKKPSTMSLMMSCLRDNCLSFLWFVTLFEAALLLFAREFTNLPTIGQNVAFFLCLSLLLGLHYLLIAADRRTVVVLFCGLSLFLTLLWPGPEYWGGATLKSLGIGGEIPVTLLVKTLEIGKTEEISLQVPGCLILLTGNQVLIRPTADIATCSLRSKVRTPFAIPEVSPPFKGLESYNRADVLRISEFSAGSVHGLDPWKIR